VSRRRGEAPASSQQVAGFHAVLSALRAGRVTGLRLAQGRRDARSHELQALAGQMEVPLRRVPREELDALGLGVHQGVVAEVSGERGAGDEAELEQLLDGLVAAGEAPLLLILEGLTDPRNLGACLRSADAAGAHAVVVPRSRTAPLTPAARKTASGAAETVPVIAAANLARTLRWLTQRGLRIIGLAGEGGAAPWDEDLRSGCALVMGAEDSGLRRLTREHCDALVALPMVGTVESLNVSVAAGIALFEVVRQRSADRASG
jgi:23S rRNA (guanosine2251-2'-O)-methyltransferase